MSEAEEAIDTSVEDASVSEAEATTDDDVALEDIEMTEDELFGDDDSDDDDEAEDTKEEVAETSEESESSDEEEAEVNEETEEEDTTSKELSDEERKKFNDEMAKRRIAEKQLAKERKEREDQDLQRFLDEAKDDEDELERRKLQVERFNNARERAQLNAEKLQVGIDKAIASLPIFREGTDVEKEELLRRLDEFERSNVVKDQHGNVMEVKADVYQFLQNEADSISRLTGVGATQQTKNKADEKTRTMTRPSRTPKEPVKDADVEAFDDYFDKR